MLAGADVQVCRGLPVDALQAATRAVEATPSIRRSSVSIFWRLHVDAKIPLDAAFFREHPMRATIQRIDASIRLLLCCKRVNVQWSMNKFYWMRQPGMFRFKHGDIKHDKTFLYIVDHCCNNREHRETHERRTKLLADLFSHGMTLNLC